MGYFISFTGSLPPGIITLGVLQASLTGGFWAGIWFSLGALLVEGAFVWFTLEGMAWLSARKKWFKILEILSLGVVAVLAIGAGWVVFHPKTVVASAIFLPPGLTPFFAGMLLRLLTPTLIPFWLGWNTTLFSRGLLLPHAGQYRAYLGGIAAGTVSAHTLFILLSTVANGVLKNIQTGANWLIFIALATAAVLQIWKLGRAKILFAHK